MGDHLAELRNMLWKHELYLSSEERPIFQRAIQAEIAALKWAIARLSS